MSIVLLGCRTAAGVASLVLSCQLFAQSYSPLYAPKSTNLQQWTCINESTGAPIPGASWYISDYGWFAGTNDHLHYTTPPTSTESPTSGTADGSGNFQFNLNPSLIGQAEYYEVTCQKAGYNAGSAELDYAVGYTIYWVSQPGTLYQIGGNTTNHGDNTGDHWMMSSPAYGIYYTAIAYLNAYNKGNQVCDNDMALPFGGKFDINDNWTTPHVAHDIGSAVDIAITSSQCPANYVVKNPSAFVNLCISNGAVGGVSYAGSKDIHCNWVNPNIYPH